MKLYHLLILTTYLTSCNGQVKTNLPIDAVKDPNTIQGGQPKIIKTQKTPDWTQVFCSIEDKAGNIWFSTTGDGVYVYNGNSFTHFTTSDGLINNKVFCLLEDKSGNISFGTERGACFYNGKKFTNLPIPGTDGTSYNVLAGSNSINNNKISSQFMSVKGILQDQGGNLWFSSDNGVYRYDGKNLNNYLNNECGNGKTDAPYNIISYMFEDKKGNIWFNSRICGFLYRLDVNRAQHPCIKNTCIHDLKNKQGLAGHNNEIAKSFVKIKIPNEAGKIEVCSHVEDRKGNIWFGTYYSGVYIYDGQSLINFSKKENLSNNYFDGKNFTSLSKAEALDNNFVSCIFEDKPGNIWFGTYGRSDTHLEGNGVFRYDGKSFTHYTKKNGLSTNNIMCMKEDKAGNIWIGTENGGVSRYDGNSFTNFTEKDGLSNNVVLCILEDISGKLWFGTRELGVCSYDGKSFTNFTEDKSK